MTNKRMDAYGQLVNPIVEQRLTELEKQVAILMKELLKQDQSVTENMLDIARESTIVPPTPPSTRLVTDGAKPQK